MADTVTLSALDFLPDNLQEGNELYPWLAELIDHALPPSPTIEDFPLDELLGRLGVQFNDNEAVNSYFNKFIKPVIGTRPAMEFAFQLMDTNARIIEWFENETPVPAFKFIIEFDNYPGILDFNSLLDMIYALKNERSWPTIIRMADCAENLVLDYGYLDNEPISASEGYMNELGVMICLYQQYNGQLIHETPKTCSVFTGAYGQWYEHHLGLRLDYSDLDQPFDESWSNIQMSRGAITSKLIRHDFASEYCAVPDDLITHGYCLASYVNVRPYWTATFECQIVPSDYGTLSGGEGFPGEWVDIDLNFQLDHDEYTLSNIRTLRTPIIIFEWLYRAQEHHDRTDFVKETRTWQTGLTTEWLDIFPLLGEAVLDRGFAIWPNRTTEYSFLEEYSNGTAYDPFERLIVTDFAPESGYARPLSGGFSQSPTSLEQPEALPPEPPFLQNVLVPTDHYHTATYDYQLVLSDNGTLSGEEGFIAEGPNFAEHLVLSGEGTLSGAGPTTWPLFDFSRVERDELIEQIFDPARVSLHTVLFPLGHYDYDTLFPNTTTGAGATAYTIQHVVDLYPDLTYGDWEAYGFDIWGDFTWDETLSQPIVLLGWSALSSQTFKFPYLDLDGNLELDDPRTLAATTHIYEALFNNDLSVWAQRFTGIYDQQVTRLYPDRTWDNYLNAQFGGTWEDSDWEETQPQPIVESFFYHLSAYRFLDLYLDLDGLTHRADPRTVQGFIGSYESYYENGHAEKNFFTGLYAQQVVELYPTGSVVGTERQPLFTINLRTMQDDNTPDASVTIDADGDYLIVDEESGDYLTYLA